MLSRNWQKFLKTSRFTRARINGDVLEYPQGVIVDLSTLPRCPKPGTHMKIIMNAYRNNRLKLPRVKKQIKENIARYQNSDAFFLRRAKLRKKNRRIVIRLREESLTSFSVAGLQHSSVKDFVRRCTDIIAGESIFIGVR